jgi:hypothetical protein
MLVRLRRATYRGRAGAAALAPPMIRRLATRGRLTSRVRQFPFSRVSGHPGRRPRSAPAAMGTRSGSRPEFTCWNTVVPAQARVVSLKSDASRGLGKPSEPRRPGRARSQPRALPALRRPPQSWPSQEPLPGCTWLWRIVRLKTRCPKVRNARRPLRPMFHRQSERSAPSIASWPFAASSPPHAARTWSGSSTTTGSRGPPWATVPASWR